MTKKNTQTTANISNYFLAMEGTDEFAFNGELHGRGGVNSEGRQKLGVLERAHTLEVATGEGGTTVSRYWPRVGASHPILAQH